MRSLVLCLVVFSACTGLTQIDPPLDVPVGGSGEDAGQPIVTTPDAGIDAGAPVVDAGQPALVDDAEVVSVSFPARLDCGQSVVAQVTVRNTGTTTWTKAEKYRLGAIDDSDPLNPVGRIFLDDTEQVLPNATRTFDIPLTGTAASSSSVCDWQMLKEDAQYTVWAVVRIGGQWYTSGYIQMWNGRASTGAPLLTDFAMNWAYDGRWGPMMGHQPQVGEQMGFFVTAGNARGDPTVTSFRERSNVVIVNLPANDEGTFSF